MPDHHSSCPLEPVDCPFKDASCTEKIARKGMEDHMTGNQQKHMLLIFQSLKQSKQELQLLKSDLKREINSLEERIRCNTNTPESTTQSLSHLKSILQENLDKIGDTLTFRVTDFPQLIEKKRHGTVLHSVLVPRSELILLCIPVGLEGVKGHMCQCC